MRRIKLVEDEEWKILKKKIDLFSKHVRNFDEDLKKQIK